MILRVVICISFGRSGWGVLGQYPSEKTELPVHSLVSDAGSLLTNQGISSLILPVNHRCLNTTNPQWSSNVGSREGGMMLSWALPLNISLHSALQLLVLTFLWCDGFDLTPVAHTSTGHGCHLEAITALETKTPAVTTKIVNQDVYI